MSFDKEQNQQTNRQIKLASRPSGEPTADNFDMATSDIPTPNDNEMLLRTVYLSLDPYMRGRMSDAKSYADPLAVGDVIMGGTVAQVVESNVDGFAVGDLVVSNSGCRTTAAVTAKASLSLIKTWQTLLMA